MVEELPLVVVVVVVVVVVIVAVVVSMVVVNVQGAVVSRVSKKNKRRRRPCVLGTLCLPRACIRHSRLHCCIMVKIRTQILHPRNCQLLQRSGDQVLMLPWTMLLVQPALRFDDTEAIP